MRVRRNQFFCKLCCAQIVRMRFHASVRPATHNIYTGRDALSISLSFRRRYENGVSIYSGSLCLHEPSSYGLLISAVESNGQ